MIRLLISIWNSEQIPPDSDFTINTQPVCLPILWVCRAKLFYFIFLQIFIFFFGIIVIILQYFFSVSFCDLVYHIKSIDPTRFKFFALFHHTNPSGELSHRQDLALVSTLLGSRDWSGLSWFYCFLIVSFIRNTNAIFSSTFVVKSSFNFLI